MAAQNSLIRSPIATEERRASTANVEPALRGCPEITSSQNRPPRDTLRRSRIPRPSNTPRAPTSSRIPIPTVANNRFHRSRQHVERRTPRATVATQTEQTGQGTANTRTYRSQAESRSPNQIQQQYWLDVFKSVVDASEFEAQFNNYMNNIQPPTRQARAETTPRAAQNPEAEEARNLQQLFRRELTPRGNAHSGAIESNRRISAVFTNILNDYSDHPTLCILNADGVLTAYNIQVRQERTNSTSSTSSLSLGADLSPSPASANPVSRSNVHEVNIRVKAIAANQWFLHRGRDAANVDPPLASNNLLIGYAQPDAVKEIQTSKVADYCLQHIEVDTYSAPHRRLWMGPQFMFCVYANSEHASAPLFNPNDTHSKPSYATASKRCPVLLEKSTDYPTLGNGFTVDSSSRIVCGSWSSEYDMRASIDPRVKETLEDAMRDLEFDDLNTSSDGLARQRHSSGNVPDLLTLSGIDN